MEKTMPLYKALARTLAQLRNLKASNNQTVFLDRAYDSLAQLEALLPSGSGIDCGTKIDRDDCEDDTIALSLSYHHMADCGMYDGWTEHSVVVSPAFDGIDLRVTGRNRNGIKEYLADEYHHALTSEVYQDDNGQWHHVAMEEASAAYKRGLADGSIV